MPTRVFNVVPSAGGVGGLQTVGSFPFLKKFLRDRQQNQATISGLASAAVDSFNELQPIPNPLPGPGGAPPQAPPGFPGADGVAAGAGAGSNVLNTNAPPPPAPAGPAAAANVQGAPRGAPRIGGPGRAGNTRVNPGAAPKIGDNRIF